MTRILLVDDHAAFRQPLRFFLERDPEFTVAAQAGSLAEARGMLEGIDVAIVDLDLPDGSGVELVGELRVVNPRGRILVLTADADRKVHARAVEAGAAGETCAAMTPCMRLYAFLGRSLADEGVEEGNAYAEWIETYSAPDFETLASTLEGLLDRYATDTPAVRAAYRRAMNLELAFFEASPDGTSR